MTHTHLQFTQQQQNLSINKILQRFTVSYLYEFTQKSLTHNYSSYDNKLSHSTIILVYTVKTLASYLYRYLRYLTSTVNPKTA